MIFGCNHLITCHSVFSYSILVCSHPRADFSKPICIEMLFGDSESIETCQCLEMSDYKHPTQKRQNNLWKISWCFPLPGLGDQVWLHCRRNFEQNMDQMAPDDILLAPVCQGAGQYGR